MRMLSLAVLVLFMAATAHAQALKERELVVVAGMDMAWVCHGNKIFLGQGKKKTLNPNAYTKKLVSASYSRKANNKKYPDTVPGGTVLMKPETCNVDEECNICCSEDGADTCAGDDKISDQKTAICKSTENPDVPFEKMMVMKNSKLAKVNPVPGGTIPGETESVCTLDKYCIPCCNGACVGDPHIQVRLMHEAVKMPSPDL